ncbi:MAG: hypothetical protein DRI95_10495 [Bacteroidetes bacterium]|nr:MAG: hypothetical protein DRI95_10495 [Bacteroidota bacterium]
MEQSKRVIALDAFRGFTIALMILVNTPGSWSYVYPPFRHAEWHGCTPTDLVFPFFLFIVGVAMWFSFKAFDHQLNKKVVLKIIKRTLIIFAIGVGLKLYSMLLRENSSFRLMGVLQRIALAYGFAAILALSLKQRSLIAISAFLLLGYWFLLWFFGGDAPYALETNLARTIDLKIIGTKFLYKGEGIPFDPEGLLATIPSIVTVILGYFTGQMVEQTTDRKKLVLKLALWGVLAIFIGLIWDMAFPINKKIWTSSYVIYAAGYALVILSLFVWLIDVKHYKKWAQPFIVYGMNPLFIYVLSGVWIISYFAVAIGDSNMYSWLYKSVFVPIAGNMNGSLLFGLFHIALYWLIGLFLYRKKIFIKI